MARQDGTRRRQRRIAAGPEGVVPEGVVRLAGVVRRNRRGLLLGTALQATVVLVLALPARAQLAANARPMGGVVVGGAASISRTAGATNIDQSTQRAAVNWQSFDVGSKQAVNFQQPNAAAVVLNRVVGPNPSQIAGQINANGQVILENQDGITFLKGAQINTAGLVATAAGITTKNFMAGNMVFDQPAAPNAAVVNEGHITVREAGIAALVAPQVANSGVIEAKLGRVVLAGASTATLDLYGDGLVSIDVNGEVKQVPVGPDGKPVTALVTNTGTIIAAGGRVLLTARQAAGLVQNLVVAGGTIATPTATTATGGAQTGQIVLNGIGGSLVVAGALLAQGNRAGQTGGQIEVAPSGGVSLASTARLDASGVAGGGTVAIGTDLARASGGPTVAPTLLSHDVTVAKGAVIAANATGKGNGGRVTVLSAASTAMHGTIAARGGPLGGDGGFVEVSGQTLGFDGSVDVGAVKGNLGSILFDPGTLDIINAGSGAGSLDASAGSILNTAGTTYDTVSNGAINNIGSSGNVILQASTLLDVQASVSVTNSLTMQSGGNLLVDAGITVQAGTILSLGSGIDFISGHAINAGSIALGSIAALIAPTVILDAGTGGGVQLNNAVINASSVFDVSAAGGGVAQAAAGAITTPILQSTSGVVGAVALNGANTIASLGSFAVTSGDFALTDTGSLAVTGPVGATDVTINAGALGVFGSITAGSSIGNTLSLATSGGTLALDSGAVLAGTTIALNGGTLAVNIGTATVNAATLLALGGAGVTEVAAGTIVAGTLAGLGAVTGAVDLAGSLNAIASIGSFAVTGGDFVLADGGAGTLSLPAGGTLVANNVTIGAGGVSGLPGTIDVNGGTIALNSGGILLALNAGTGGISLTSGALLNAGTVTGTLALMTAGGGVTQDVTSTIQTGTLVSSPTVVGTVDLAGTRNNIGTLGGFTVTTGDLIVTEGTSLALAVPGAVTVGSTDRIGLRTDTLSLGGTLNAGTVALAPATSGATVALGTGPLVTSADFAQINAGRIDIGSLDGGATITAGAITINAGITPTGTILGLYSLGSIVETGTPPGAITVGTLVGQAGSGIALGGANTIESIVGFAPGGGQDFTLTNSATSVTLGGSINVGNFVFTDPVGTVTVAGTLIGQNITIDPTDINVTGTMSATGSVIALDAGTTGTAGTITLGGTSALLAAGGTVELSVFSGSGVTLGAGMTQAVGGVISAGTLFSANGVSGGVDLAGSNTIASIGSFAVTNGGFVLADAGAGTLTLASSLTADNVITLGGGTVAPGSIVLNGGTILLNSAGAITLGAGTGDIAFNGTALVNAGTTGTLALGAGAGGITQSGSAIIVAGTLVSNPTVVGTVNLAGTLNSVGTIGGFTVTAGDFALADGGQAGSLVVPDRLVANNVTLGGNGAPPGAIAVNAGTILLNSGGTLIALNAGAGSIVFTGTALVNAGTAGTLALGVAGGGVTQDATAILVAGTLVSGPTVAAAVDLAGTLNSVGAIGGFTVTAGDFVLADSAGTLTVPAGGMLEANDVTIGAGGVVPGMIDLNGGTIALNGTGLLALNAGTGGISLASGTLLNAGTAGTLALGAQGHGVTQVAGGAIFAGTLISGATLVGSVDLAGTKNVIGTLGAIAVTSGDFTLIEAPGTGLTVAGSVSAAAGHAVAIGADSLTFITAAGTLAAGTVALAPVSSGTTISLGTGLGLDLPGTVFSGNQISAGTIDIGTLASGATIASAISITSGITVPSTTTLDLVATGGVVEAGGSLVGGGTLTGHAGSFTLLGGNTIAALGALTATGTSIALADAGALTVSGAVSAAAQVYLQDTVSGGITLASGGALDAGTLDSLRTDAFTLLSGGTIIGGAGTTFELAPYTSGSLETLGTNTSGLSLASLAGIAPTTLRFGAVTVGGTLDTTAGSIAVAGTFDASGDTIDLEALNGIGGSGSLSAGTLIGNAGTGAVALTGAGNDIGTLGSLAAGGALAVADSGNTDALTVAGPVTGAGVDLSDANTGSIVVSGLVGMAGGGTLLVLNAGSGGILFTAGGTLSAPVVELASAGTIAETLGSILATGSLLSLGTVAGTADLASAGNQIGTLAGFAAGGDVIVTSAGSLAVSGPVTGADVALNAGTIGVTGSVGATAGAGTVALAAGAGTLTLAGGALVTGPTVDLTGSIVAIGASSGAAAVVNAGSVLALGGTGASEGTTGTIIAGTLASLGTVAAAVTLTGPANSVTTLAGFTSTAGFALADTAPLTVAGAVSGGSLASITDTGLLSVTGTGTVNALAISLSGTSLAIGGLVTDGGAGATSLIATTGSITELGTLIVGTLSGHSSLGATSLTGSNTIATLGSFTAAGFTLDDGATLAVNGPVSGGTLASITDTGLLSVTGTGTVNALAISLSGTSLAIGGLVTDGGAGATSLIATTGSITELGTLIVGTLSGHSSLGATSLTGSNTIATLGSFTAAGFTLDDGATLAVNGPVSGGTLASITDTGLLSVTGTGTVNALAISLSGTSLAIGGLVTDGGAGATSLIATTGSITELGTLIVGTLSGHSSLGATSLTGSNTIATLGSFTAAGFTLDDGATLAVNGPVSGGTLASITDTGLLSVTGTGTVNALAISLSGTSLAIGGLVTDGGAGATSLIATTGSITELGTLIVGTLSGHSSLGATSLTGSNTIAMLGSFTAAGFTLDDGATLAVNGPVSGGTLASITDTGLLSVTGTGTVGASAVSLTGSSLTLAGLVSDGGGGTTSLVATGGTLSETGTLQVGTLSGSSTGATSLTGSNTIATLGAFTALGGLTLDDGAALTVTGVVNGGGLALLDDTVGLTVHAGAEVTASAVSLTAPGLTLTGLVSDGGAGTIRLVATNGTIAATGTLVSGTLSGSSTGATSLTGSNAIAALGNFSAAGLTVDDGAALTVTGSVAGGSFALLNGGAGLTVGTGGTVIATTVDLTAPGLTIAGLVSDGGSGTTRLTASNGAISETGALVSGTLSGSSTGATSLTGANAIATLGNFSAVGLTLDDGAALTVTGTATGGSGAAGLSDSAGLTVGAGGQVNASAVSLTGASLTLAGVVSDGGTGTTSLTATAGAITETGQLVSGTLSGSSTGATGLTGTNTIAILAGFTAAGGLTLNDGGNLTVAGPVAAGPMAQITVPGALTFTGPLTAASVTLNAASLNLGSTLTGTTQVALAIGGAVSESGTLDTALLTGSSGAATTLTSGGNQIGEIATYTAGSTLNVTDGTALTLSGVLNAPTMVFDATPNQITIANGTTLVTGGYARPTGPAGSFTYPTGPGSPGAYFSDFQQLGAVTVASQTGGPSIMRIDAEGGGNVSLAANGGLFGTSTWLILDMQGSGAIGEASGNIFVRWLDLVFPFGSSGGGADLSGTVNGIGGQAAAGAAHVFPLADARFRFNSCAIGSVNCVVLPVEVLPLANPLQEFSIGSLLNSDEEDDLFLPLVSRRDY